MIVALRQAHEERIHRLRRRARRVAAERRRVRVVEEVVVAVVYRQNALALPSVRRR